MASSLKTSKSVNKAHTATVHRISRLHGHDQSLGTDFDVRTPTLAVEVETSASLRRGVKHLSTLNGGVQLYLAVTNKECVNDAIHATDGTEIGVMDPYGKIVKPCTRAAKLPSSEFCAPNSLAVAS